MQPWNPDAEEASTGGNIIPKGAYRCFVSEAKQHMKNIDSVGIQVVLQIVEHSPQAGNRYNGRKVFLYFTWSNPSEMAVMLGRRKLSDLLFATGKSGKMYNSASEVAEDLSGSEIIANVTVTKRTDTGEDKNDVAMFFTPKGVHRGPKQSIKMYEWGGIENGTEKPARPGKPATGAAAYTPAAADEDVPF
jgi:hypothetical protein